MDIYNYGGKMNGYTVPSFNVGLADEIAGYMDTE
jgi:hypothetical protein